MMSKRPQFSIITPTYNHECFVGPCIESVLAQTREDWEQIIIDDGSTDRTAEVVARYSDPRIKYVRQQNRGIEALAHTYNQALELAGGDLIVILEGDDTCPADKLQKSAAAFDDRDVVLLYGEVQETSVDGNVLRSNGHTKMRRSLSPAVQFNDPVGSSIPYMLTVKGHSLVAPASAVIRRSTLESIGGFHYVPGLCLTDFPTFIMLAPKGKFAYVPDVLGYRRMHSSSVSFQYYTNIFTTQQKYTFQLLKDPRFKLTERERSAVMADWNRELPRTEFTQGRISLHRREWEKARSHFRQAMTPALPRVCLGAAAGWLLSWIHCDLEKAVSATGRIALQDKNTVELG